MTGPRRKEKIRRRHTPKPVRNPEALAKQRRRLTAVAGKRNPARPSRESFGAQRGAGRATLGPDHVVENADRAHRRTSDVSGKLRDRPMIAVRIERRRRSDGVDFQSPTDLTKPPRRTTPARIATRRGSCVSPVKEHRSRRHQRKPPQRRVRLPPPDRNELARAVRAMRATPVRDEHNAGQTPPAAASAINAPAPMVSSSACGASTSQRAFAQRLRASGVAKRGTFTTARPRRPRRRGRGTPWPPRRGRGRVQPAEDRG